MHNNEKDLLDSCCAHSICFPDPRKFGAFEMIRLGKTPNRWRTEEQILLARAYNERAKPRNLFLRLARGLCSRRCLFSSMIKAEGVSMITKRMVLPLLEACRCIKVLKQLHALMIVTALVDDVVPLSRLIDSCVEAGENGLSYARSALLRHSRPSAYMWNSLIRGFSGSDEPKTALSLYRDMQRSGVSPDNFTYPFALKACSRIPDHVHGKSIHGRVIKTGYEADVYVSSTLIQMYVSCMDMWSAKTAFDSAVNRNVVSWTTMIAGYVENDQFGEAIRLFREMNFENVVPNEITMVHVLVACAQSRDLETGRRVHGQLRRAGADSIHSNVILATALVDMYARCGSLKTASHLFERMHLKNEVSWNSMISAYNQYGRSNEVLQLYREMCNSGLKPDKVTLLNLLGACTDKGAGILGQAIHACSEKKIGNKDVAISTSLMDMYCKIGDTQNAMQIFWNLETKDVMTWTSMIIGLAMHGNSMDALDLFKQMQQVSVVPDYITFIGVLTACSHAGMVNEGQRYFESMESVHGITPGAEHYGCMVDLLSRAGRLSEAMKLLELMPAQPSIMMWGSMLSGCEVHGDVVLAERIRNDLSEINPQGSGTCVLLSNIYAAAGRWQEAEETRRLMWHKRLKKTHGSSFIA